MTVEENLELGAFVRRSDKSGMRTDRDRVFGLFPRLAERRCAARRHALGR